MQANVFGGNWIVLCDDMYQLRTPATAFTFGERSLGSWIGNILFV